MSRPPRARGLKQTITFSEAQKWLVAPPAGAWIETAYALYDRLAKLSRPPRARGLKPLKDLSESNVFTSRPPRARGLKHRTLICPRQVV